MICDNAYKLLINYHYSWIVILQANIIDNRLTPKYNNVVIINFESISNFWSILLSSPVFNHVIAVYSMLIKILSDNLEIDHFNFDVIIIRELLLIKSLTDSALYMYMNFLSAGLELWAPPGRLALSSVPKRLTSEVLDCHSSPEPRQCAVFDRILSQISSNFQRIKVIRDTRKITHVKPLLLFNGDKN